MKKRKQRHKKKRGSSRHHSPAAANAAVGNLHSHSPQQERADENQQPKNATTATITRAAADNHNHTVNASIDTASTTLAGVDVIADTSMSMMYSEDGSSTAVVAAVAVNNMSLLNNNNNTSAGISRSATHTSLLSDLDTTLSTLTANTGTGGGGVDDEGDRFRFRDDNNTSFASEDSSIMSGDHYFCVDDNYIFTDEESSSGTDPRSTSMTSNVNVSDKSNSTTSIHSPTAWEHYNKERGKLLAQTLLHKAIAEHAKAPDAPSDTEDEADDEESQDGGGGVIKASPITRKKRRRRHKRSLLERAVQSLRWSSKKPMIGSNKCWLPSPRPIDNAIVATTPSTTASYSPAMSDCSSHHSSPANSSTTTSPTTTSSAVHARNALVDFHSWEARLISTTESSSSPSKQETDVKNNSTPQKEDDDKLPPTAISASDDETCAFQDWEHRATADDILQELGLDDHGRNVLDALRHKAGNIIDWDVDDQPCHSIPWIHIAADYWMPHYEEYVVRSVHAFAQTLTS